MRLRAAPLALAALMLAPATAGAAGTVAAGPTVVSFDAAPGVANDLTVSSSPGSVTYTDTADVINEASAACEGDGTNTVTCTATSFERAVARLDDMNDRLRATGTLVLSLDGGDGNDELTNLIVRPPSSPGFATNGGDGDDRITTGDGRDVVFGDDGSDSIVTGAGADFAFAGTGDADNVDLGPGNDAGSMRVDDVSGDTMVGGPGLDSLDLSSAGGPVGAEVDLVAGTVAATNQRSTPATGFEDVSVFGHATAQIRGTPGSNDVETIGDGADTVDPREGSDFLSLGGGADRALLRDGFADFVRCGDGEDSAEVDQLDTAAPDCENVAVAQVRPAAAELGPPGCTIASVRARITRRVLLRRGLTGAVECARPATLEVRLLAGIARRGGGIGVARAGDVVLAERSLPLAGGRRPLRLRVIRRLRASVPRTARLRLQVVARDEFGNTQIVTKRLRVTSPRVRSR